MQSVFNRINRKESCVVVIAVVVVILNIVIIIVYFCIILIGNRWDFIVRSYFYCKWLTGEAVLVACREAHLLMLSPSYLNVFHCHLFMTVDLLTLHLCIRPTTVRVHLHAKDAMHTIHGLGL